MIQTLPIAPERMDTKLRKKLSLRAANATNEAKKQKLAHIASTAFDDRLLHNRPFAVDIKLSKLQIHFRQYKARQAHLKKVQARLQTRPSVSRRGLLLPSLLMRLHMRGPSFLCPSSYRVPVSISCALHPRTPSRQVRSSASAFNQSAHSGAERSVNPISRMMGAGSSVAGSKVMPGKRAARSTAGSMGKGAVQEGKKREYMDMQV